jgi:hypothetical protein
MGEMKSLTRRELYDLVWSKPITKLAADFGISDVGLAKICDRYRVPSPPRGYWAKLEAGKKVKQAIFAEALDPHLNRIEIKPGVLRIPESAREILKQARAASAERKAKSSSRPSAEAPVFDPITEVHPDIRRTATILRKAKPDTSGSVCAVGEGLCGVVIGAGSTERVVRILDLLARQLETKGLPITLPTATPASLALVNTPNGKAPVELRQTPESAPGLHEALVAVQAFSLNRGELRSFRNNEEGWIPGQDISGIVLRQAADGSGPPAGTRIVALMDEHG